MQTFYIFLASSIDVPQACGLTRHEQAHDAARSKLHDIHRQRPALELGFGWSRRRPRIDAVNLSDLHRH
jgi:hypothetical protein